MIDLERKVIAVTKVALGIGPVIVKLITSLGASIASSILYHQW